MHKSLRSFVVVVDGGGGDGGAGLCVLMCAFFFDFLVILFIFISFHWFHFISKHKHVKWRRKKQNEALKKPRILNRRISIDITDDDAAST